MKDLQNLFPPLFPAGASTVSWSPQKRLQRPWQTSQISSYTIQAEPKQVSTKVRRGSFSAVFLPVVLRGAAVKHKGEDDNLGPESLTLSTFFSHFLK